MSNVDLESFSREDLMRIMKRDRFVKEQQSARIGSLVQENIELMGIIQELQADLELARKGTSAASNGEVHAEPAVL